jgi:predicted dehydrogenase
MKSPKPLRQAPGKPIRVGVIGLGQIAVRAHLPGYDKAEGCQLTAVHSGREAHAKQVAAQFGIPYIYKSWEKLLESDHVDAVSICTPNFIHMPIALKAMQEGKHVLVEKPLAMNTTEARDLIAAAKKYKRVLMVHHNMRFDPAVRTAGKLLQKNTIGEIYAFKCSLTHRGPSAWSPKADWFFNPEKAGGGALMDLGPHVFDSLSYLLEDQAIMSGAGAAYPKNGGKGKGTMSRCEVHCACLLRFKKGTVGTVNLGWVDTTYQNRFYFFGTKGTLSLNLAKGDPITLEFRDKEGRTHPPLDHDSFYPSIYQHFIDCIRNGKTPWASGEEGLRTLELVEAGYRFLKQKTVTAF